MRDQKKILTGNDVNTEGYFVMEDGTEMTWLSHWHAIRGTNYDAIMINTENNFLAGSWIDEPISGYSHPYICEKNEK